jgi:purine nucleoside permease
MALGLDPRFDLSHAYWVVAGIAGANPKTMSLGSAAWAEWIVDGDLAFEIDAREIPEDWSTGYVPLDRRKPFEPPAEPQDDGGNVYRLDQGVVDWAYGLTRNIALADSKPLEELRRGYAGYEKAQQPPAVIKGDTVSASTFWHGGLLNQWAIDWVGYWTDGKGSFATTAMEDTGTLQSLTLLGKAGKVDRRRVLVLRTASNFSMPPDGQSATNTLPGEGGDGYSAFLPSLDAAYLAGSAVANEIAGKWETYRDKVPGAGK